MSNRSALNCVPITTASSAARRNPVARETIVPNAIQALARAIVWSVIVVGRPLGRHAGARTAPAEATHQGGQDQECGEAHRDPQHDADVAGSDVELVRLADRLAVGRLQA